MMIIAAGFRQVHLDIDGNKYVLFDQGIYAVPSGASIKRKSGGNWIYCEAHGDYETGSGYADIGGVQMKYVYDPDKDVGGKSADAGKKESEESEEADD